MNTSKNEQYTDTSSEQIQYKEDCSNENIPGTPLWLIKENEDNSQWILTFGKFALKKGNSKEELKSYVEENAMNVMTNIVICVVEELKNINSNEIKDDSL